MSSRRRGPFVEEIPESVRFSDPALPPGLDAGEVRVGIDATGRWSKA